MMHVALWRCCVLARFCHEVSVVTHNLQGCPAVQRTSIRLLSCWQVTGYRAEQTSYITHASPVTLVSLCHRQSVTACGTTACGSQ
jgi:hypothetical protein